MPKTEELIILLNNTCNLCCTYCNFREDRPTHFAESDPDHVEKAITFFFASARQHPDANRTLCFNADGEVLLSRHILLPALEQAAHLRDELHAHNTLIVVITNATLVNAELAAHFARLGVVVTVSVDGAADVHNRHRVKAHQSPTHSDVLRGIQYLHAMGVPVSLRAVVSPDTVTQMTASYWALRELMPARPIKLRPLRLASSPYLPEAWVSEFTAYYVRCVEDLFVADVPLALFPDDAYYFARYITTGVGRSQYCAAGRAMLWMLPTGQFATCGLLTHPNALLGHIDDISSAPDAAALLTQPFAGYLRDHAPQDHAPCLDCRWRPVCQGGCPALPLLSSTPVSRPPLCTFYATLGVTLEKLLADTSLTDTHFETIRSFD